MLYEFKSRATGSVTMTGDVGKIILEIIGKRPEAQGIITVAQMPAAITALQAAVARERAAGAAGGSGGAGADSGSSGRGDDGDADRDDPDSGYAVGFAQRAYPLIDMLQRAHAAGKDVTWGV
ncbi:MAG: DUF1840 domain-containing protein [Lautropia sp.]